MTTSRAFFLSCVGCRRGGTRESALVGGKASSVPSRRAAGGSGAAEGMGLLIEVTGTLARVRVPFSASLRRVFRAIITRDETCPPHSE